MNKHRLNLIFNFRGEATVREKLISLTKKDFRWDYFRGSGKGGQKRNKTESGVRCTHEPSGAVGQSDDTRQQHKNKSIAFKRMSETKKFKNWLKLECARATGVLKECEEWADREMKINTIIQVQKDGRWVDLKTSEPLNGPQPAPETQQ